MQQNKLDWLSPVIIFNLVKRYFTWTWQKKFSAKNTLAFSRRNMAAQARLMVCSNNGEILTKLARSIKAKYFFYSLEPTSLMQFLPQYK
jgi:hypothetical protein